MTPLLMSAAKFPRNIPTPTNVFCARAHVLPFALVAMLGDDVMVAQLRKPFPCHTSTTSGLHSHLSTIVHEGDHFSHADADSMCRRVEMTLSTGRVVIDLTSVGETETSAFARLVLLRRSLLRSGRDLSIVGLRDQARGLFEVNRLEAVLPREN